MSVVLIEWSVVLFASTYPLLLIHNNLIKAAFFNRLIAAFRILSFEVAIVFSVVSVIWFTPLPLI
jgi:hypothetical protein